MPPRHVMNLPTTVMRWCSVVQLVLNVKMWGRTLYELYDSESPTHNRGCLGGWKILEFEF